MMEFDCSYIFSCIFSGCEFKGSRDEVRQHMRECIHSTTGIEWQAIENLGVSLHKQDLQLTLLHNIKERLYLTAIDLTRLLINDLSKTSKSKCM